MTDEDVTDEDVTQHLQGFNTLEVRAQREHLVIAHARSVAGVDVIDWQNLGQRHALLHEGPAEPVDPFYERARAKRADVAQRDLEMVRSLFRQRMSSFRDNFGWAEDDPNMHYVVTANGTLVRITLEVA